MKSKILATVSCVALTAALPAFAQSATGPSATPAQAAANDEPAEIVVTGQRAALASAQAVKRDAPQIVDSIVAQDIGKFPDNAVSESLQRITGVQVFRDAGETNRVVIRGLPNVVTTLNGREIFTGSGRGFAFQDLPAEAVSQLNVYKTSSADLIEGGIAGLVNIDLHKPFDFKGLSVAATARGVYSDYAKKVDPIAGLLISDRWDTNIGEIGALIDVSYRRQHYLQPDAFSDPRNPVTIGGQSFLVSNAIGAFYTRGHRERPQINGALQWKPTDNLELYVDGLYAKYKEKRELDFFFGVPGTAQTVTNLQLYSASDPGGCSDVNGAQLCELKSGTFSNGYTATSTQAIMQHSHDAQISTGAKFTSDRLRLSTDLTYTDSSFGEDIFIIDSSYAGQTFNLVSNDHGHVNYTINGNDYANPSAFALQGLFQTNDRNHGDSVAWRGDLSYEMDGPLKSITAGLRYVNRNASAHGGTQNSTPAPVAGTVPSSVFGNDFWGKTPDDLGIAGIPQALTPDINYLLANKAKIRTYYGISTGAAPEDPTRAYAASENSYALYAQGKYGFNLGSIAVDGLFGLRYVENNRDIDATSNNSGVYSPVSAHTVDRDWLPNASIRAHLTPTLQARFSYAKTASRPDFGSLNPSLSLAAPTVNRLGYGSGGNPDLSEIKSDNLDASLEWYFGRASSLTLTAFHRDISGYIQNYSSQETFGGVPYTITRPQSAGSGTLKGIEVSYQQFYDFLPGALSGLGLQLNYTYIKGQTQAPAVAGGANVITPLGNVSKNNGNAVLIYEKYGVSARLAYNYRSKFIDSFNPGGVQTPAYNVIKAQDHLDFSISYDILPSISLTADATNITKERAYEYVGTPLLPQHVRLEDRTFSVGARVKF